MRRFVQLAIAPLIGPSEVVVEVPHATVPTLALELGLLVGGLAESLRLRADEGPSVILALGADDGVGASEHRGDDVRFQLGTGVAEYLHAFLLRTYANDVADVDHVHLASEPLELTVMFERSREHLSIEDARALRRRDEA